MFYRFDQNNSGGCFHTDDLVCIHVIIEAHHAAEANDLAEGLGIYFNGVEDETLLARAVVFSPVAPVASHADGGS